MQEVVELASTASAALAHKPSGVSADDLAILQSMDTGEALHHGGGCGEPMPALKHLCFHH